MLGGADNPNGELPSYITGANKVIGYVLIHFKVISVGSVIIAVSGARMVHDTSHEYMIYVTHLPCIV